MIRLICLTNRRFRFKMMNLMNITVNDNGSNNFDELNSFDAIGDDDSIQNAADSSQLPDDNANNSFEEKKKVRFLNLIDEILEISGDELDNLRE